MENVLFCSYHPVLEARSLDLGYSGSLFLGRDFVYVYEKDWKKYLSVMNKLRKSKVPVMVRVSSEQQLVHAIEQSSARFIVGAERVHYKDSVHYLRSGLDVGLLQTVVRRGKVVCFAYSDFVLEKNVKKSGRLLALMKANYQLCVKMGINVLVSSFGSGVDRSYDEINSFLNMLKKK